MLDSDPASTSPAGLWPWRLKVAAIVALAAAGTALIALWAWGSGSASLSVSSDQVARDSSGQVVHLDTTLTPEQLVTQHAIDAVEGQRLRIPSLGFDVPLGAITASHGEVTPPWVLSAYWIRNLGVSLADATKGTVYVVIHTVHGNANVPGNKLIDIAGARSALSDGAAIEAGGRTYHVTKTAVISRDALPTSAEVWTSRPGQLVLITCLERPDGSTAISNVVVWADLA